MRVFVSLPIDISLQKQLENLPRKGIDASWVYPADYHITLRYIGDAEQNQLEDIKNALKSIKKQKFGIEIDGLSHFLHKNGAVLYADVQSKRKITDLAAEINVRMAELGFEMPQKPYIPHVTLARVKNTRNLDKYIKSHGKKVRAGWKASHFELMQSGNPQENMPRYKVLQVYDLQQFS